MHDFKSERKLKYWTKWTRMYYNRCFYCLEDIFLHLEETHPRKATLDHVKARANGGVTNQSNLVFACRECNMNKGDK